MSDHLQNQLNEKEIKALISLLDDPDKQVHIGVTSKLLSLGSDVVPTLENFWETSFDPILQKRIEEIINKIQHEQTIEALGIWAKENSSDLLAGAIFVAKYQYPDLDSGKIEKQIEKIQQDIWVELNDNLTVLEKIKVFNEIIYNIHGFSGNVSNLLDPQNTFLNIVLETKKGSPVSLGIIYLAVANRMNISIYGINLPQHFILGYPGGGISRGRGELFNEETESNNALFYINPFNKGSVFSEKEIYLYLKKLGIDPYLSDEDIQKKYLAPCSNIQIIRLLVEQLIASYEELGYLDKMEDLKGMLNTLD